MELGALPFELLDGLLLLVITGGEFIAPGLALGDFFFAGLDAVLEVLNFMLELLQNLVFPAFV